MTDVERQGEQHTPNNALKATSTWLLLLLMMMTTILVAFATHLSDLTPRHTRGADSTSNRPIDE